ncbi:hypothetical protein ACFSHT_04165 [Paraburkholderia silviterrae]|uniref:Uncharacterized protein n=1 Tax=Paraburkholderia silviterrae TaxID=2528715 RepID=A0A4R5M372_9BURK|nr:hypothetical protein [Paraburkholderia silviterrae]TDG20003.1 hypothetical protein EYW47_27985 [Paraburkholderia silviterrae]
MVIRNSMTQRLKSLILISIAAASFWQFDACSGTENPANTSDAGDFVFGVMNGVNLKIPRYYLFAPVIHEGEPRIDISGIAQTAHKDPEIDTFGMLLRMSNLQPIRTEQDKQDWLVASRQTMFMRSWLMVSLDKRYHLNLDKDRPDMIPEWGPYILDKNHPFNLMHFESVQSVDDGMEQMYGHVEYFYDKTTDTTIFCQTFRMRVTPFSTFDICQQRFLVPKLHVMASATYTKKDLYKWPEIEGRIVALIDSFARN